MIYSAAVWLIIHLFCFFLKQQQQQKDMRPGFCELFGPKNYLIVIIIILLYIIEQSFGTFHPINTSASKVSQRDR